MRKPVLLLVSLALSAASIGSGEAQAAENAAGFYLLGTKGSMAGFVPPPGAYFVDVNYWYSGNASGSAAAGIALRDLGDLTLEADVKVDGNAYINLPSGPMGCSGKDLGR